MTLFFGILLIANFLGGKSLKNVYNTKWRFIKPTALMFVRKPALYPLPTWLRAYYVACLVLRN